MKTEETISYLANIYAVVAADGVVDRVEERVFETIARDIGAGYFARKQAVERAGGDDDLPAKLELRWSDQIRNIEDMLFVAYCDSGLDPTEKRVIIDYANVLGRVVEGHLPRE